MERPSKKGRVKVKVQDKRRAAAQPNKEREDPAPEQVGAPASGGGEVDPSEPGAPAAENVGAQEPEEHDYLEDLKRLQAEFENYRKRMMRDQTRVTERASARLVERLLPVLDNFERAIDHGDVSPGVELVYKELRRVLAEEGLEEIPADGLAFDPNVHEAVESREDPDASEIRCVTVYRRGYRVGDKVLRPAMVGVVRPPEQVAEEKSESEVTRLEADGG